MNFKIIETERLFLRPVLETDVQDFFELDSNPKVHIFLELRFFNLKITGNRSGC